MVENKHLWVLAFVGVGVTGLSNSIVAQGYVYKDDYGEPIINVGGVGVGIHTITVVASWKSVDSVCTFIFGYIFWYDCIPK